MINLKDYELFRKYRAALKELSRDNHDLGNDQYMTESKLEAVDFDKVKTVYTNQLGLSEECAASADALLQTEQELMMVEFKNGKVNNRNVKDKVRDSLLLFCDITEKTISYTREKMDFIVVYNLDRNPLPNQLRKQEVQDAPSREEISSYFLRKGKEELIRFDLERYKHLYFREVHTYTQEEFDTYLKDKFPSEAV